MLTDFSCFEFLLIELVQLSFKVLRRQYHCNHGFTSSQGNFSKFTYTTSHGEAVARRCSIKRCLLGNFIKKETRTEFFVKFLRTLFFTVCLRATFLCLKNVIKLSQKETKIFPEVVRMKNSYHCFMNRQLIGKTISSIVFLKSILHVFSLKGLFRNS